MSGRHRKSKEKTVVNRRNSYGQRILACGYVWCGSSWEVHFSTGNYGNDGTLMTKEAEGIQGKMASNDSAAVTWCSSSYFRDSETRV